MLELIPSLVLVPLLATPRLPVPAPQDRGAEPVEEVVRTDKWLRRYERNGPDIGLEEVQELEELVRGLRDLVFDDPQQKDALVALLDVAGVRTAEEQRAMRRDQEEAEAVARKTERVRELGYTALGDLLALDGDQVLAQWMATEVMALQGQPQERRLATLRLFEGRHNQGSKLGLFSCAVEDDEAVRAAAMQALEGWQDDEVHEFMLGQLERLEGQPGWVSRSSLRRHFDAVRLSPDSEIGRELFDQASRGALGNDWRAAFRSIRLLRCLPDDPAVPALIEALATWTERRDEGGGSLRIEYELLLELERRSGRSMGAFPDRWRRWWKAEAEERANGDAPGIGESAAPGLTRAAFFGLRAVTDRVVFVIDRSGSMKTDFSSGERSRYGEAIEQMLGFLRTLGPRARFSVILFSSDLQEWKPTLQPATERNLKTVERWLRYQGPEGGTYLKPAIAEAMKLNSRGVPDLARLEADSIIVLCDGATTEGPGWIRELLEATNEDACLAFHGVQVGDRGDGALELLAELSGGHFVQVR